MSVKKFKTPEDPIGHVFEYKEDGTHFTGEINTKEDIEVVSKGEKAVVLRSFSTPIGFLVFQVYHYKKGMMWDEIVFGTIDDFLHFYKWVA